MLSTDVDAQCLSGECPLDPGGYFVVKGTEKVIISLRPTTRLFSSGFTVLAGFFHVVRSVLCKLTGSQIPSVSTPGDPDSGAAIKEQDHY